jgi:hypothetical protein
MCPKFDVMKREYKNLEFRVYLNEALLFHYTIPSHRFPICPLLYFFSPWTTLPHISHSSSMLLTDEITASSADHSACLTWMLCASVEPRNTSCVGKPFSKFRYFKSPLKVHGTSRRPNYQVGYISSLGFMDAQTKQKDSLTS